MNQRCKAAIVNEIDAIESYFRCFGQLSPERKDSP